MIGDEVRRAACTACTAWVACREGLPSALACSQRAARLLARARHLGGHHVPAVPAVPAADGVVAQDSSQARQMWHLREGISEGLRHRGTRLLRAPPCRQPAACACTRAGGARGAAACRLPPPQGQPVARWVHLPLPAGAIYKYDVSLPVPQMYRLVEDMRRRLAAAFPDQASSSSSSSSSRGSGSGGGGDGAAILVAGYGHLGDGNLHLNISGGCRALPPTMARAATPACGGRLMPQHLL
jgi:D-2-hydroxyglutarate dehydrogenase